LETLTRSALGYGDSRPARVLEQARAVVEAFPALSLAESDAEVVLTGTFVLEQEGVAFDAYEIRLHVPLDFPASEPALFETGARIARSADLHVNDDGSACYEVFEYWLATTDDSSLLGFVRGPMLNFFLSQTIHELTGNWPFGERSHGVDGLLEATAAALGVDNDPQIVAPRLKILRDWPAKGHLDCPCGSGTRFRDCHRAELSAVHQRVPPALAKRLIDRILSSFAKSGADQE